jgi:hypothetical protein
MLSRIRARAVILVIAASVLSSACYITQDASGQWYACETLATANGPVDGCTPIPAPF